MKDLIMFPIVLGLFAFGYYVILRVDRFIEENQRLIANESKSGRSRIRIAAENPMLLSSFAPALESCSRAEPHIAVFLSSGRASRILENLLEDRIDIALLSDRPAEEVGSRCEVQPVYFEHSPAKADLFGLPVEDLEQETRVYIVWKKSLKSKDRDRVLFALQNEHCRLRCGYADYLG